jgi:flagellin
MQELINSINSIAKRTTFSGNSLLSYGKTTDGTTAVAADSDLYSMQISNTASDKVDLSSNAFLSVGVTSSIIANGASGSNKGQAFTLDAKITAIDTSSSALASDVTIDFQDVQTAAKAYVEDLGTQRSLLGAYQNQMEYTLGNITELSSNLQSARSRVIDTDYASETASLTKGQILQQAATAMLAQANQMPNVILTLLK